MRLWIEFCYKSSSAANSGKNVQLKWKRVLNRRITTVPMFLVSGGWCMPQISFLLLHCNCSKFNHVASTIHFYFKPKCSSLLAIYTVSKEKQSVLLILPKALYGQFTVSITQTTHCPPASELGTQFSWPGKDTSTLSQLSEPSGIELRSWADSSMQYCSITTAPWRSMLDTAK